MKLSRIKSVFPILLSAMIFAALCFALFAVNGKKASAAEEVGLNGFEGYNFVYSAEFTPEDGAKKAGLVFGAVEDNYFEAVVEDGKVKLMHSEEGVLKTADCTQTDRKFKLTVVMNGDVAKVFIDSDVAAICCKIDNYAGGKLGLACDGFKVSGVTFIETDIPEGDIYCNGYDVLKVVNITDGNRKLSEGDYTVREGVVTVSPEYLKTLEADTQYIFRAVTSFTDFDFKIKTDFTAVTVTSAVEKYYRDNDVTLELSGNITVNKLLIDGKECAFTQTEDRVVISAEEVASLSTGSHKVKLYTDKGRPETTITVSEIVETVTEPVVKSTRIWLWIDLAIFLSAIIGYTAFSIISKRKKK